VNQTRPQTEEELINDKEAGPNHWEVDITSNLVGLEIERSLPGGVSSSWKRDKNGRPVQHSVTSNEELQTKKRYQWDVNDRLRSIEDLLKNELTTFEHDVFGNLSAASYADGSWDYKLPDEIGNLFKTKDRKDRKYGRAGQLLKDEKFTYEYDEVGNLIKKESINETWRYKWTQGGMLKKVIRPDRKHVDFTYDALGRRLTKTYQEQTTHFVWDGNVPLHEWTVSTEESNSTINEKGETEHTTPENLITWIFEDGTFIPMAKLQGYKSYSIITDHLGTPVESYDEEGKKVWSRELNIYGETRKEFGEENFIPFLYQGQYLDTETELAYNRFRYYSPESGTYVSQDPIGLEGHNPNFYAYTKDNNCWVDPFGLDTFYQLYDSSGNLVYEGITERHISERMSEHARDGKVFSSVRYVDDLPNRVASRNLEGSSLYHNRGNTNQLNKRRLDGGFYHSYDPQSVRQGRTFMSESQIEAKMQTGKTADVDSSGRMSNVSCI
jgi:RHS repeat-associated protein